MYYLTTVIRYKSIQLIVPALMLPVKVGKIYSHILDLTATAVLGVDQMDRLITWYSTLPRKDNPAMWLINEVIDI